MRLRGNALLSIYSGIVTAALCFLLFIAAAPIKKKFTFDEIDVQRINFREPDGTLRMVLANHAKLPGIIVRGKEQPFERPQAGIIFYNDEGSENGGLIFGGRKNSKGEVVDSGGSLSFDRYDGNQEVQLIGVHDKEDRFAGLVVSDSPPKAQGHRRIWVGKNEDGAARVELRDANGKKRLVLEVLADGAASLNFLDAEGKVVNRVVPQAQ
ncbi:MAG TPA: hypothetical protein VGQ46_09190 [Thermoanaerobaculia bacterium]|jgi:hypothetical protein|nr:hypothetical protein [Thermoanaerobaculia bacterium]